MKCINCKKEVIDGQAFCIYCGEKLSNNIENTAEYNTNINKEAQVYGEKVKNVLLKNKKATAIGVVAIIALIIGIFTFNYIKGVPVSKDKVQTYLAGQSILIDGNYHEIKSEEIKSLEITSRNSENKSKDRVEGTLSLELDNASVASDINYELYYNNTDSKWVFSGIRNFQVKKIEPKVDLNDSINELLKDSTIYLNYDSIKLKDGLLKEIKDVSIEGESNKKSGKAKLLLSNGVVESTVSAEYDANFDLDEGKWKLVSTLLKSEVVDKEKISENISDEDKKKFVLTAFENGKSCTYKYKAGNYDTSEYITLSKDNITDLKIKNFMEYEDTIRAEVEGEATIGEISKVKFSGVVNLDLSLSKSYNTKVEVNIDSLEVANVNTDSIKKDMLKYKVDDKQITVAMADTFNIGTESEGSSMFDKIYAGEITVDGAVKKVKCRVGISLNRDTKKYEWKLDGIDTIK